MADDSATASTFPPRIDDEPVADHRTGAFRRCAHPAAHPTPDRNPVGRQKPNNHEQDREADEKGPQAITVKAPPDDIWPCFFVTRVSCLATSSFY
jgi:hypothetical protein